MTSTDTDLLMEGKWQYSFSISDLAQGEKIPHQKITLCWQITSHFLPYTPWEITTLKIKKVIMYWAVKPIIYVSSLKSLATLVIVGKKERKDEMEDNWHWDFPFEILIT